MRAKNWLIVLALAGAGLGAAAALAPRAVDWNKRTESVTRHIEAALGRKVEISGPISLRVLPRPSLSIAGVRVEGDGTVPALDAPALTLALDFGELLAGRLGIARLALEKPVLTFARQPQAAPPSGEARPTAPTAPADGPVPARRPAEPPRLSISGATIIWRQEDGQTVEIGPVEADVEADERSWHLKGALPAGAASLAVTAELARTESDGARPLALALALPANAGRLDFSGRLAGERLAGRLSLVAGDAARAAGALGLPAAMHGRRLKLDGTLDAGPLGARLDDVALDLGEDGARGRAQLDLSGRPRLDLSLAFARLDLDGAGPVAAPALPSGKAAPAGEGGLADTPGFTLPAFPRELSAGLEFRADLVSYRGGVLRQAKLNAQLDHGEILIDQGSVILPGDTEINLFGFLSESEGRPRFSGSVEGISDHLRGLLEWGGIDLAGIPADKLQSLRLAGEIHAEGDRLRLAPLKARLDGMEIGGTVDYRPGKRGRLGLDLAADRFDADILRPPEPKDEAPGTATGGPRAEGSLVQPALPPEGDWLDGIDAGVKLRLGSLSTRGKNLGEVALEGDWNGHRLTLKSLSIADLAGVRVRASGGIERRPFAFQAFSFDLRAASAEKIFTLAGLNAPVDPARLGAMVVSGTADGMPNALSLDWRAEAGGTVLNFSGTARGWPKNLAVDALIDASNASTGDILRLIDPGYRQKGALGAFALHTHAVGGKGGLTFSDLRLKLGPSMIAGDVRLMLAGRPRLDLSLNADDLPLDLFLPVATVTKPHGGQERRAVPAPRAPARVRTQGNEPPAPSAAPRPKVETLAIDEGWAGAALPLGWLAGLDGTARIAANTMALGDVRLNKAELGLTARDGVLALERLTGQVFGGTLHANGRIGADGAFAVNAEMGAVGLKGLLKAIAGFDRLDGPGDIALALTGKGRSGTEMMAGLSGEAALKAGAGTLEGIDLATIARADGTGQGSLLGLIEAALRSGRTRFDALSGTFRAVKGVVSTSDLSMVPAGETESAAGPRIGAAGALNLAGRMMDARIELRARPDAPALTLHLSGPFDQPRQRLDINAFQTWLTGRPAPRPR